MTCVNTEIPSHSSISFLIPARLSDIRLLSISVRALFSSLGFSTTDSFQLELAVVEAANNIVLHAYQQDEQASFEMEFAVIEKRIICTFKDQGIEADFLQQHPLKDLCRDIQILPEGNRGICIICNVMDEVSYIRKGQENILMLVKHLPRDIE